jgi:hypothetical protein
MRIPGDGLIWEHVYCVSLFDERWEGQTVSAGVEEAIRRIENAIETGETSLDLAGLQLTELPPTLVNFTHLAYLQLGNNQLTELPDWLTDLTNLTGLYLRGNQLASLPESLGGRTNRTGLHRRVSRVAASWWESLGRRTNLTGLFPGGNQLASGLTNLTTLDLGDNQLASLPESLGDLTTLTTLYLDGNQLAVLPRTLGRLPALQDIAVTGNPLPVEVIAAAAEGSEELLNYLRLVHDEGVEIAEAKLVFVGEGEVGKSTLLAALRGDPWIEDRLQTHGMEMKPVTVYDHHGNVLILNGWDFGGQQIYRPTHQLFFTAPAVYLVMWKPRPGPELGMVEHWLETIQHRAGPGARVHVVATHGGPQERVAFLDEAGLRERFGDLIVNFHAVDSRPAKGNGDGYGLAELKSAIAETASKLPHVRRWYPNSWLKARKALAARPEQSLTYSEYETMLFEKGLTKVAARSLAINAHALGNWIHYADEPTLAEVVILKPAWLSVAIARVLQDPEAAVGGGLVTHRRLGYIWSTPIRDIDPRYTHTQQQVFLRLMERFNLTYRLPELAAGEPLSLLAQLVPNGCPDLSHVWYTFRPGDTEAVEICRIFEKRTGRSTTPDGLIYRLIVRLHQTALTEVVEPQNTHWQGGLIAYSRYGARALVTLTPDGVRVHVRGPDPRTFLRQVTDEIRNCVDGFWPGLASRALVPCSERCSSPGQGMFDIDKLIKLQDDGRPDPQCPVADCDEYPSIASLLGGIAPRPKQDSLAGLTREIISLIEMLNQVFIEQKTGTVQILRELSIVGDDLIASLSRHEDLINQLLRGLNDEAADGPRLFSLTPIDTTPLHPGWTTRRMRLTLYCEHSRWPIHALDQNRTEAGVYTLKVPREWWTKAAPLLKVTAALVKPFLGIGLAAAELGLSDSQWGAVEKQLSFAKEILTAAAEATETLADPEEDGLVNKNDRTEGLIRAEGGILRTFHAMLKEQDIAMADLRRVRDQQGRFLWVHPRFLSIYQPPLPQIPK